MRTRHHRGASANIPNADNVSDCIYRNLKIAFTHPINEKIAAVHIFVGECEPTIASAFNRRYFG
jgi:hypothetical protein